jgi:hypothetical protein
MEKDFVLPEIIEGWYDDTENMSAFDTYICENFKRRSIGLLCDFADNISKVYTAVFPSDKVLTEILENNINDAMLFVHHPLVWDLSKDLNKAFYPPNIHLLKRLKERQISIFNFHLPLDNYGMYATPKRLPTRSRSSGPARRGLARRARPRCWPSSTAAPP